MAEAKGVVLPPDPMALLGPAGTPGPSAAPMRMSAATTDTAWSAEKAVEFLRTTRRDRPRVLHAGAFRPHPPFSAAAPCHAVMTLDRIPALLGDAAKAEQHTLMRHWLGSQKRPSYYLGATGPVQPLLEVEVRATRQAYTG